MAKLVRCFCCNQVIKAKELNKYYTDYYPQIIEPLCKNCYEWTELLVVKKCQ